MTDSFALIVEVRNKPDDYGLLDLSRLGAYIPMAGPDSLF